MAKKLTPRKSWFKELVGQVLFKWVFAQSIPALKELAEKGSEDARSIHFYLGYNAEGPELRRRELFKYLFLAASRLALNKEMVARLRTVKWDQFLQTVNELQAAYVFRAYSHHRIQFRPSGNKKSVGEFLLRKGKDSVFVEVKAPVRQPPGDRWSGNDEEPIRRSVKSAYKQLPEGKKNIVVVAGELKTPITDPMTGIVDALYGQNFISVPINIASGGPAGESRMARKHNGLFKATMNRKISAVVTIEEHVTNPFLNEVVKLIMANNREAAKDIDDSKRRDVLYYLVRIYHNPYAANPIDPQFFKGLPQLVPNRNANQMVWTDLDEEDE